MEKRRNCSSFPHYFIYIFSTSGVKLHIHLLNVVVQFIAFLTLSELICRGTDISKYFSESLWIRDNESRLYFVFAGELWSEKLVETKYLLYPPGRLPQRRVYIKGTGYTWYSAVFTRMYSFLWLPVCIPAHQWPSVKASVLKGKTRERILSF